MLARKESALCPHIPENLWPENPVHSCSYLVGRSCEDNETGKVVLDEFAHFFIYFPGCFVWSVTG